jgi:hypothetical protein
MKGIDVRINEAINTPYIQGKVGALIRLTKLAELTPDDFDDLLRSMVFSSMAGHWMAPLRTTPSMKSRMNEFYGFKDTTVMDGVANGAYHAARLQYLEETNDG